MIPGLVALDDATEVLVRFSLGRLSAYEALQELGGSLPEPHPPRLRYRAGELVEVRKVRSVDAKAWWTKVDEDCRYLEDKHWIPAFEQLFVAMGARFAGRIQGSGRRWSRGRGARAVIAPGVTPNEILRNVFHRDGVLQDVRDTATGLYGITLNVATAGISQQVGMAFNVLPAEQVGDLIRARSNRLAGHVADSIYDGVKRTLVRGTEAGDSIPDLADRVRVWMGNSSKTRATRIARTEVISAYNGAVRDGGDAMPGDVVTGYEWIATMDGRVRPAHLAANHQKIRKGETFHVMGQNLRYPGDPLGSAKNIINCRCAVAPLVDEDALPPPVAGAGTPMAKPAEPVSKPSRKPKETRKTGPWSTETPKYQWTKGKINTESGPCEYTTRLVSGHRKIEIHSSKGPLTRDQLDAIAHGMDLANQARPLAHLPKVIVMDQYSDPSTLGFTYTNIPTHIYLNKECIERQIHRANVAGQVVNYGQFHPASYERFDPWTSTMIHEYGHCQDWVKQARAATMKPATPAAVNISRYATTNRFEEVAEGFASWTQMGGTEVGYTSYFQAIGDPALKSSVWLRVKDLAKKYGWQPVTLWS